MEYGFWDFLQLVGALGIFIYGMKIMSEGLQKAAGSGLRKILKGMTKNRLSGILTGALTTVGVQSSSATTVMIVSFVNAGLLSLAGALGVIMGANIGTTITAWLVAVLGFKVKITPIAIALIGVSFPMMFIKKWKWRHIAEFIIGFGILFIGLSFLKDAVPDLKANPDMLAFVSRFTDLGFLSILIFIALGTILTVIIQSSSAATAITLTMVYQGWIPFDLACAMILGENIGTTITANIAAAIANVQAKRAALFHTIFNLTGVFWMLILFNWYVPVVETSMDAAFNWFQETFGEGKKGKLSTAKEMGVALFHTSFNILNVLLLVWFVPYFEKLVCKLIKPKGDDDEDFSLQYISTGLVATPELAISNAKKEAQNFGKLVNKMFGNLSSLLFDKDAKFAKLSKKIAEREGITDEIEEAIAGYLAKLSEKNISTLASKQVQAIMSINNNLESIADEIFTITLLEGRLQENSIKAPESIKNEIKDFFDLVGKQIEFTRQNLKLNFGEIDMQAVFTAEQKINESRNDIKNEMFARIEKGKLNAKQGFYYIDIIDRLEKIGDQCLNVNQALALEGKQIG